MTRTQKLILGFIDARCARKELLGQLGTVVVSEPGSNEIQVGAHQHSDAKRCKAMQSD